MTHPRDGDPRGTGDDGSGRDEPDDLDERLAKLAAKQRAEAERIVRVAREHGVELGTDQAVAAWRLASERLAAGWLCLPPDDELVWQDIEEAWAELRGRLAETGAPEEPEEPTETGVRLGHVELFCADTERSLAFYRDVLGAPLVAEQPGGCKWVTIGAVTLLLRPGTPGPRPTRYAEAADGLVLYCDDLPGTLEHLKERGLLLDGDDGAGCPTFTDPDGHWFQLVDPRDHS